LITGAGSGIGRAAALAFAREGARVIAVDIDARAADDTVTLVEAVGGRANAMVCDVSDGHAVDLMFTHVLNQFGPLDFAFNNAGIAQNFADTADIEVAVWSRIFRVNIEGVWHCMRNELRHMVARGSGAIVNTASIAGLRSVKRQSAYVASKHAVVGLTKNAAIEYAARGIRVNAVCPGGVATKMANEAFKAAGMDDDQVVQAFKDAAALHPMLRIAQASEIADAAVFLCSDKASFINGICLSVDGGWAAI